MESSGAISRASLPGQRTHLLSVFFPQLAGSAPERQCLSPSSEQGTSSPPEGITSEPRGVWGQRAPPFNRAPLAQGSADPWGCRASARDGTVQGTHGALSSPVPAGAVQRSDLTSPQGVRLAQRDRGLSSVSPRDAPPASLGEEVSSVRRTLGPPCVAGGELAAVGRQAQRAWGGLTRSPVSL